MYEERTAPCPGRWVLPLSTPVPPPPEHPNASELKKGSTPNLLGGEGQSWAAGWAGARRRRRVGRKERSSQFDFTPFLFGGVLEFRVGGWVSLGAEGCCVCLLSPSPLSPRSRSIPWRGVLGMAPEGGMSLGCPGQHPGWAPAPRRVISQHLPQPWPWHKWGSEGECKWEEGDREEERGKRKGEKGKKRRKWK